MHTHTHIICNIYMCIYVFEMLWFAAQFGCWRVRFHIYQQLLNEATIVHARPWWWGFDILSLNILRSCQQKHIQCLPNRLFGSSPTNSTRVFLRVGYRTETFWCNTSRLDAPCHFWSSLNTSLVMQFDSLKSKKHMNTYEKRCCIQVPHMDSILAWVAWRSISCLGKNTQWQ